MRLRSESRWVGLRRDAIDRAEDLVRLSGGKLPTNLGKIAARQGVRAIEFRQLISDGGLAIESDGFLIYVNAGPGEGEDLTLAFAEDGVGTALPRQIIRRVRFTVAHEIAHTFFYDRRSNPPRIKIDLKNATAVKSLERVCNSIAGTLLLPEFSIQKEFANIDLTKPSELARLADAALISKHALVRRLQEIRRLPHPFGVIACVERRAGQCVIDSVSKHYSLRYVFTKATDSAPLACLVDHPDFLPNGGDLPEVDVELMGMPELMRVRFRCDERLKANGSGSFFVTGTRLD